MIKLEIMKSVGELNSKIKSEIENNSKIINDIQTVVMQNSICLESISAKVSEETNLKVFNLSLTEIVNGAVTYIQSADLSSKVAIYLFGIRDAIFESVELHLINIEKLDVESIEFSSGLEKSKSKFSELFGKWHADKHYSDIQHYQDFLDGITEINSLSANSKKERYIGLCKLLMQRSCAKCVHYVVNNLKVDNLDSDDVLIGWNQNK